MTEEKQPEHRLLTRLPEPLWQLIQQDSDSQNKSVNYVVLEILAAHYGLDLDSMGIVHRAPKRKTKK